MDASSAPNNEVVVVVNDLPDNGDLPEDLAPSPPSDISEDDLPNEEDLVAELMSSGMSAEEIIELLKMCSEACARRKLPREERMFRRKVRRHLKAQSMPYEPDEYVETYSMCIKSLHALFMSCRDCRQTSSDEELDEESMLMTVLDGNGKSLFFQRVYEDDSWTVAYDDVKNAFNEFNDTIELNARLYKITSEVYNWRIHVETDTRLLNFARMIQMDAVKALVKALSPEILPDNASVQFMFDRELMIKYVIRDRVPQFDSYNVLDSTGFNWIPADFVADPACNADVFPGPALH